MESIQKGTHKKMIRRGAMISIYFDTIRIPVRIFQRSLKSPFVIGMDKTLCHVRFKYTRARHLPNVLASVSRKGSHVWVTTFLETTIIDTNGSRSTLPPGRLCIAMGDSIHIDLNEKHYVIIRIDERPEL